MLIFRHVSSLLLFLGFAACNPAFTKENMLSLIDLVENRRQELICSFCGTELFINELTSKEIISEIVRGRKSFLDNYFIHGCINDMKNFVHSNCFIKMYKNRVPCYLCNKNFTQESYEMHGETIMINYFEQ
jgi:hypothetical protein